MRPFLFVCAFVCLLATNLFAQSTCSNGRCYPVQQAVGTVVQSTGYVVGTAVEVVTAPVRYLQEVQPVRSVVESFASGLAQSKAERQAAMQQCCHVGGGFGGGRAEGVGFSTSSPEDAVRRCCYYGQRPIREQGVAYGYNRRYRVYGWYATIICD